MDVKYVSTDGLARFLTNLQTALATNSASSFTVNYATSAANATGDNAGHTIADYYASNASVTAVDGRVTTLDGQVIKQINFTPSGASSATALTPTSGAVALDLSGYALKSEVASAMDYKGSATGVELAAKTVANTRSGDVYTCSADSGNFHAGLEYVAVITEGEDPDPDTLSWEELGKWVDLSGYVQKKTAANGYIATFDSTGDVVSTGVSKDVLQNGSVATGNTSFVTGGDVFTVTNGLDGRITNLENAGYIEEVQVNGTALTETSGAVNIDISAYTDQTLTANSAEPASSVAVLTAIAGFANVYDDSSTPAHVDNLYEATASDIDALFS